MVSVMGRGDTGLAIAVTMRGEDVEEEESDLL
jgi:hypothetical protein